MVEEISIEKARDKIQNKIVYQYELTDEDRLNEKYECAECNQRLRVRTNKNKLYHFYHPEDSCIVNHLSKDDKKLIISNIEYRRSDRHSKYQDKIIEFLKNDNYCNIEKEKSFFIDGKVKHRADIYFEDDKHKFVIEVQISPLSFKNILKRIEFYKSQGIYLLWVVDVYHIDESIQQFLKDILEYGSSHNEIFLLNSSGILQVHYQEISYWKNGNKIWEKYSVATVNLNNLSFNEQDMTVCFYDREEIRKKLYLDNPLLLLDHISIDSDNDLEKKLKYYEKYYPWMSPKFLELIDAIFLKEYKYWDGKYYDIFLFLIKSDMIKTLRFLLEYGLRRREVYSPKINDSNLNLLKNKSISHIKKELSYYYFLDENKILSLSNT